MPSDINLIEDKLTQDFWNTFLGYYSAINVNEDYKDFRQQQWQNDQAMITYRVERDFKTLGWIIFNPGTSSIEEMQLKREWTGKGLETPILDAMIEKESLISLEIL